MCNSLCVLFIPGLGGHEQYNVTVLRVSINYVLLVQCACAIYDLVEFMLYYLTVTVFGLFCPVGRVGMMGVEGHVF